MWDKSGHCVKGLDYVELLSNNTVNQQAISLEAPDLCFQCF